MTMNNATLVEEMAVVRRRAAMVQAQQSDEDMARARRRAEMQAYIRATRSALGKADADQAWLASSTTRG